MPFCSIEQQGTLNVYHRPADPARPLEGRREAIVTDQRTTIDYAQTIRHLVDVMLPDAEMIVLVRPLGSQCYVTSVSP